MMVPIRWQLAVSNPVAARDSWSTGGQEMLAGIPPLDLAPAGPAGCYKVLAEQQGTAAPLIRSSGACSVGSPPVQPPLIAPIAPAVTVNERKTDGRVGEPC